MSPESAMPRLGLFVIGDEILSGRRSDMHLSRVIELLGARGLQLAWAEYLLDDPAQITAALRRAFATPDMVFSTGGIGATPDDHTRQCAAAALGVPLALHPEARRLIQARITKTAEERGEAPELDRPDNLHRLKMGEFPVGAELVPNPYNGIPGFSCRGPGGGTICFLPGFPVMAWPMIEWALEHGPASGLRGAALCEHSIVVFDIAESVLAPIMEAVEAEFPGVKVFSLPSVDHPRYGRHIDLGVKGPEPLAGAAYRSMLDRLAPMALRYGPESTRS